MARSAAAPNAPFFVIGSPRSGTTLLRLMLTTHPRLVIPPECGFVLWFLPRFGQWSAEDFENPDKAREFVSAVSASRKFETWRLDPEAILHLLRTVRPRSYGEACACVYRLYGAQLGKEDATWGDKNNHYLKSIGSLAAIFPSARFLHIVRDGRDVACSCREVMALDTDSRYRPSLPVTTQELATQWRGDILAIRTQFAALSAGRTLELRYEDLVVCPEKELIRVCDWLGCKFSPEMLRFDQENRRRTLEPRETMDWKRRTLEPVSASTVGRYRQELTASEIDEFCSIAGAELRAYGYLG